MMRKYGHRPAMDLAFVDCIFPPYQPHGTLTKLPSIQSTTGSEGSKRSPLTTSIQIWLTRAAAAAAECMRLEQHCTTWCRPPAICSLPASF